MNSNGEYQIQSLEEKQMISSLSPKTMEQHIVIRLSNDGGDVVISTCSNFLDSGSEEEKLDCSPLRGDCFQPSLVPTCGGNKTPPSSLSPDSMKQVSKKTSPTSILDIENLKEGGATPSMDAYFDDSLLQIIQEFEYVARKEDTEDNLQTIPSSPVPERPPRKPTHRRLVRSHSDYMERPKSRGSERNQRHSKQPQHGSKIQRFHSLDGTQDASNDESQFLQHPLLSHASEDQGCHQSKLYHLQKMAHASFVEGDIISTIKCLETIIPIQMNHMGSHHIDVAASLEQLAVAQLQLPHHVEYAHANYRKALCIQRSRKGHYHPDVAHILTQIACIEFYSGDIAGAEANFEGALDIYRYLQHSTNDSHSHGDNVRLQSNWNTQIADALCSLGTLHMKQMRFSCAIQHFVEALEIQKQFDDVFGSGYLITLDNLGFSYYRNKQYNEALVIYEDMLRIQVTCFQGYNMDCFRTLRKLNSVYCKLNRLNLAIDTTLESISFQQNAVFRDESVMDKTLQLLQHLRERGDEM